MPSHYSIPSLSCTTLLRGRSAGTLSRLLDAQRSEHVREAEHLGQVRDGAARDAVEPGLDLGEADALEEHADGLADMLDQARVGGLFADAEELLGEGDAEGVFELVGVLVLFMQGCGCGGGGTWGGGEKWTGVVGI